jgi:hypothetical protein
MKVALKKLFNLLATVSGGKIILEVNPNTLVSAGNVRSHFISRSP